MLESVILLGALIFNLLVFAAKPKRKLFTHVLLLFEGELLGAGGFQLVAEGSERAGVFLLESGQFAFGLVHLLQDWFHAEEGRVR